LVRSLTSRPRKRLSVALQQALGECSPIYRKTGDRLSIFADLKRTGFREIFSPEHTPGMPVSEAVRISMSIPLFFAAVKNPKSCYVDGGLFGNYPIKLFDRMRYIDFPENTRDTAYLRKAQPAPPNSRSPDIQQKTLGFRLDSTSQIAIFRDGDRPISHPIIDFCDYLRALMAAVLNVQGNQHLHSDDWNRAVYIDTLGTGTIDFNLPDDRKQAFLASGCASVERYYD